MDNLQMDDNANIVLSKEDSEEFLRNLNNPPESVRQARRLFLEEINREVNLLILTSASIIVGTKDHCDKWDCEVDAREVHNCCERMDTPILDAMVNPKVKVT